MLLLINNADPMTKDAEGRCPVSIGKKRSNIVAKMLSAKGTAVGAYEISLQDPKLFEIWRSSEKRREEAARIEEMKGKQFATELTSPGRDYNNKKITAAEQAKSQV